MNETLLAIHASPRTKGSISRELTEQIATRLRANQIVTRDLAAFPVPQIDEAWIGTAFTAPAERSAAQTDALAVSETLVAELKAADVVVIGVPIYNFGVPAALKAWIDQVARAGVTFRYSPDGPVGLLRDKRAILAVASGGTAVGSEIDFATGYLRHTLGFIGISDVEVVHADRIMADPAAARAKAKDQIAALAV